MALTKKICMHKFVGEKECRDCIEDFNPEHHPNNYDCKRYYGIGIISLDIPENNPGEKL